MARTAAAIAGATDARTLLAFLEGAYIHDAYDWLGRVMAPTLVLYSASHHYLEMAPVKDMVTRMPNAQLVLVELEGSMQNLVDATRQFLGDLGEMAGPVVSGVPELLTRRERDVLACIVEGRSNVEIAQGLGVSPRTIDRHTANIYAKLGVHNRVEAANWTREHGLR